MPALVVPTVDVHRSFAEAMEEFVADGRGGPDDASTVGEAVRIRPWQDLETFAAYVAHLRSDVLDDTPREDGRVPCTTLWWVDDDEFLGRIAIRHRLTPWLTEYGGHIGYDVRPSRRRQGHGTAMLHAALPVAHDLGIDPVLITCDDTNTGSRKVIEGVGGRLEDQRGEKLRYWVTTRPPI